MGSRWRQLRLCTRRLAERGEQEPSSGAGKMSTEKRRKENESRQRVEDSGERCTVEGTAKDSD